MQRSALKKPETKKSARLKVRFSEDVLRNRQEVIDFIADKPAGVVFRAQYPFASDDAEDLPLELNQLVLVLDQGQGPEDWWQGVVNGRLGYFPGTFVKKMAYQPKDTVQFWLKPEEQVKFTVNGVIRLFNPPPLDAPSLLSNQMLTLGPELDEEEA